MNFVSSILSFKSLKACVNTFCNFPNSLY